METFEGKFYCGDELHFSGRVRIYIEQWQRESWHGDCEIMHVEPEHDPSEIIQRKFRVVLDDGRSGEVLPTNVVLDTPARFDFQGTGPLSDNQQ